MVPMLRASLGSAGMDVCQRSTQDQGIYWRLWATDTVDSIDPRSLALSFMFTRPGSVGMRGIRDLATEAGSLWP